jgi:NIMA (never in mitosis gene a)-related kinase
VIRIIHRTTGEAFVCKKIPLDSLSQLEKDRAQQEAKLLQQLKHPNIVQYKDSFVEDSILIIIMEYCSGEITRR